MRLAYLSIGRHVHTERWIRFFRDRGHDCHLLTVQPGPIEGVQVHDIQRAGALKPIRYWRSLGVLKQKLREIGPDLLHTHFLTGYGYWGDFSGFRPNVLTVWGDDVYVTPHENLLKGYLARRALANADAITGDSKDILRDCVKLGANAERCFEVQWGVDFDRFRPDLNTDVRRRLGIPEDATVIFSPRSFTQPYYNIDIIIQSTAALLPRYPKLHIVFAGYEGDQTPFETKARDAGLVERTHFLGRIPHDEFADHLAASDIFVSVPSVDATAVSLLEAMACGRAIVISSLPSSMEWIEAGTNGEIVPPREVEALRVALERLIEDPELRADYGERCVSVVRSRADHATNMDRVERLYRHLVEGAPFPDDLHPISTHD